MFPLGRRLALGCVAAAMAATACSGGASKPVVLRALPPTSGSPSPSASSTQTELDAVSAVVRRYYQLLNGSTTFANASALSAIMTTQCTCRDVVKATRSAVAKHEHFFGRNHVVSIVSNLDGSGEADALVTYNYTRSGLADASGKVLSSSAGRRGVTQNFRLVKATGGWRISAILRVSPGTTG